MQKTLVRMFYVNIYLELSDALSDFYFVNRQSSKLENRQRYHPIEILLPVLKVSGFKFQRGIDHGVATSYWVKHMAGSTQLAVFQD